MFSARALFFVFAFALSISTSWCVTTPIGGLRPDSAGDLAPHPRISSTYNEFWTYLFWLNNGIEVEVNLSHASFGGVKDPVCGASLSITHFQNHDYLVAREFKDENFSFDANRSRLAVHENIFFEGRPPQSHHLSFATTKKGTSYFLDLSFNNMTHGVVWGDGTFHLPDDQQLGLFFHIPKAEVHGRIAINGDTVAVEGFGWMDHSWQTHFATKLMDAGYRYVVPSNPLQYSQAAHAEGGYFFRKENTVFGYGLREEKGKLILLRPTGMKTLESMSWTGLNMARVFQIDFEGAHAIQCRWKDQRQWSSAFGEMNPMERFGAKIFLGGDLYGFRGTGVVNDTLPALFSFTLVKH